MTDAAETDVKSAGEAIAAALSGAVTDISDAYGELTLTVERDRWVDIAGHLREDPAQLYISFIDLCAVDYPVREKRFEVVKGPLAVRPVFLHKEERIRALVFCTMVALLLFALLELLVHRAGVPVSAPTVFQQFAPLAVLVLTFRDGTTLHRLTGLTPPLAALLQTLALPPPERYLPHLA